ncbi:HEPN family nuclease [Halodesulfovibrio aestuarii]|uniref:pEK499-p136 HEPN domain-containing protein n=1 Tax=Halodesulfovibrio aestuarii TaxID=126333 RepID=A0A8G2C7Y2_9BACT|nr:HEPN family nuclease [Halodesulfovibrio aestuarii]SHI72544.1 hypothetical protein SAMN05660830_00784 [Halodesulfovibrio aestuarii]
MGLYNELHRDFALRTKANLVFIDAARGRGEDSVFNVTQLINSCLGMVVFIKEGRHAPSGTIEDFNVDIAFDTLQDEEGSNATLRQFLRRFRNAISHCNIEAYGTQNDIEGFELKDGPIGQTNWHVRMDTASIRALAVSLVDHVVHNAS